MWTNKDTKKYEYTIMIGKIPLYNILMVSRSSKVIWRSFQGHLVSDLLLQHIAATLFMSLTVKVTTEQKKRHISSRKKMFFSPARGGLLRYLTFSWLEKRWGTNIFFRQKMQSGAGYLKGVGWGKLGQTLELFVFVIQYGWFQHYLNLIIYPITPQKGNFSQKRF